MKTKLPQLSFYETLNDTYAVKRRPGDEAKAAFLAEGMRSSLCGAETEKYIAAGENEQNSTENVKTPEPLRDIYERMKHLEMNVEKMSEKVPAVRVLLKLINNEFKGIVRELVTYYDTQAGSIVTGCLTMVSKENVELKKSVVKLSDKSESLTRQKHLLETETAELRNSTAILTDSLQNFQEMLVTAAGVLNIEHGNPKTCVSFMHSTKRPCSAIQPISGSSAPIGGKDEVRELLLKMTAEIEVLKTTSHAMRSDLLRKNSHDLALLTEIEDLEDRILQGQEAYEQSLASNRILDKKLKYLETQATNSSGTFKKLQLTENMLANTAAQLKRSDTVSNHYLVFLEALASKTKPVVTIHNMNGSLGKWSSKVESRRKKEKVTCFQERLTDGTLVPTYLRARGVQHARVKQLSISDARQMMKDAVAYATDPENQPTVPEAAYDRFLHGKYNLREQYLESSYSLHAAAFKYGLEDVDFCIFMRYLEGTLSRTVFADMRESVEGLRQALIAKEATQGGKKVQCIGVKEIRAVLDEHCHKKTKVRRRLLVLAATRLCETSGTTTIDRASLHDAKSLFMQEYKRQIIFEHDDTLSNMSSLLLDLASTKSSSEELSVREALHIIQPLVHVSSRKSFQEVLESGGKEMSGHSRQITPNMWFGTKTSTLLSTTEIVNIAGRFRLNPLDGDGETEKK